MVIANDYKVQDDISANSIILGSFLFLVIFILDLLTPLGIADGIGYIAIVLLSILTNGTRVTILACLISVMLIIAGYFFSPKEPDSSEFYFAITNRLLSIFVVIISSVVIIKNKKLKQNVLTKTDKLVTANKELESFNFIANHDMQEPLRKLRNFADVLLFKEEKNLSINGKYLLQRLSETAKHMQMLIDSLLTYTRINNEATDFEKTDLNNIVDAIIIKLKAVITEKGASIKVDKLCETSVIGDQFEQLIYHLVHNSLKFSHSDRSPEIVIKSEIIPGSLLKGHKCLKKARYCHICIADNGIGFDQQYKDRIFEMFQRLNEIDIYKGTGMGLAVCKKIVSNHNGFITAAGELNKGAQFDIYIPAA